MDGIEVLRLWGVVHATDRGSVQRGRMGRQEGGVDREGSRCKRFLNDFSECHISSFRFLSYARGDPSS